MYLNTNKWTTKNWEIDPYGQEFGPNCGPILLVKTVLTLIFMI